MFTEALKSKYSKQFPIVAQNISEQRRAEHLIILIKGNFKKVDLETA